ncbi:MAG: cytochrome c [Bacteroidales bacterium]|nr:cytochrome c [Bacteroidales bacterium]
MKKAFGYILFIPVAVIVIISCDRDRNHPGYIYYPDMTYSQAYETNSGNPVFADGQTMRRPAEGTVPRGFLPFPYEKNDVDMIKAGNELKNPFDYSDSLNTKRGEIIYERYCLQCHGPNGDGKGHLYTSGLYVFPPASLINDKMKKKPDGEMYHQITLGWGIMGEYGMLVRPEDRWKVIIFVKNVLQTRDTTLVNN